MYHSLRRRELTTTQGQADVILANSRFTSRVFKSHFSSIGTTPDVVYPGINISAYETGNAIDLADPDVQQIIS
jgi:alpha-1,3/alpha-1,6-mannosyltransferase